MRGYLHPAGFLSYGKQKMGSRLPCAAHFAELNQGKRRGYWYVRINTIVLTHTY
jgi:hypothetical protein